MTTQHDSSNLSPRAGREASATATDEREERDLAATAHLLHDYLGELRRPRPDFQSDLEARLVARLPEATRPWWRRTLAPAAFRPDPARRNGRVTRRRVLAGLAAGLAGITLAGGLALPLARPTGASAAEIIEKSQEFAANPLLSGIKSFHLKARTTGRPFQPGKAVTSTNEQWFVAPDKMRVESRTEVDGKTTVGGSVHVGGELVAYATPGADQHDLVGVMPIAFKATRVDGPPAEGAQIKVSIFRKKEDGGPPPDGASVGVIIRRPGPDGPPTDEDVRVIRRAGPDGAPPAEGASDVIVVDNCPPPTRKGEGTVANRKVHIVEMDHSACLPADAPAELRGRVVTWADRETYLPLKIEHYGVDGKLVHGYEVTSVEYDVAIPDSVFKDVPPSGTVRIPLPKPSFGTQAAPAPPPGGAFEKPAAPPAPRR